MDSIAILAGGNSIRFKNQQVNNKIFIKVNGTGKRLLDVIYERFKALTDDIFFQTSSIIAPQINELLPGYDLRTDNISDKGPMGGIYSALRNAKYDKVFIIAADMPNVEPNIYYELNKFRGFDCIVPRWGNGYLEPLCAIYSKNVIPVIDDLIEKNTFKVSMIFDNIENDRVKYIPLEELIENNIICRDCFKNINYLEDETRVK